MTTDPFDALGLPARPDLAEQAWPGDAGDEPATTPLAAVPVPGPPPGAGPPQPLAAARDLPSRIRRGRLRRLVIRAAVAAALSLAVLQLIPGTAAAPADVTGLITWFVLTARRNLAPRPER